MRHLRAQRVDAPFPCREGPHRHLECRGHLEVGVVRRAALVAPHQHRVHRLDGLDHRPPPLCEDELHEVRVHVLDEALWLVGVGVRGRHYVLGRLEGREPALQRVRRGRRG